VFDLALRDAVVHLTS